MKAPSLTIIIVTHNNEKTIAQCLDSLPWNQFQTRTIIVDNNSADHTLDRIDRFIRFHECRISLIRNRRNTGYAHGINQGLREAGENTVMILGPDAQLLNKAVKRLFEGFERGADIGMVVPQHLDNTGSIMRSCRRLPRYRDLLLELTGLPRIFPKTLRAGWKMPEFDHNTEQPVEQPEATCWLIRADLLKLGFRMDERFPIFFNDVDWCLRLKENGLTVLFTPEAKIVHEGGGSVLQQPIPMIWKSHQGFYRYFAKNHSQGVRRVANQLIALLLIMAATIRSLIRLLYMDIKASRAIRL